MINGDEIRQKEQRSLVGYNGSYHHTSYHGSIKLLSDVGVNLRADLTGNSALSHTIDRFTTLAQIKLGNISQLDIAPYISETITFKYRWSINAGLRFDRFYHKYNNKLPGDTTLPGAGVYKA